MKHDRGVGLEKMHLEADERLPSNKVAYQCLIRKDRWVTYKKKVLNDVIARKTSRLGGYAKLEDAPGFLANQKRRPTDLPPVSERLTYEEIYMYVFSFCGRFGLPPPPLSLPNRLF